MTYTQHSIKLGDLKVAEAIRRCRRSQGTSSLVC